MHFFMKRVASVSATGTSVVTPVFAHSAARVSDHSTAKVAWTYFARVELYSSVFPAWVRVPGPVMRLEEFPA